MLEVVDVRVVSRSRTLLDGVGFEANPGEVIGIIGPNGAGKTTLLEVIVGLRDATSANISFRGRPLRHFRDRANTFSYAPDGVELAPELDVGDHVAHALAFRGRPPALVDHLRNALRVAELVDVPAGILSRGERQRVALFCALAVERPVVILDEPFSAFDPLQLQDVLGALRRVAEAGATVVTTVHQLGNAQKVADRFLLLAEGRRVAWGTLEALRRETELPEGTLEDVFTALLARRAHAS